jgi:hypothetical protein
MEIICHLRSTDYEVRINVSDIINVKTHWGTVHDSGSRSIDGCDIYVRRNHWFPKKIKVKEWPKDIMDAIVANQIDGFHTLNKLTKGDN